MKKIIVANWKAQLSPSQAGKWLEVFKESFRADSAIQVVLAPSFLHFSSLKADFDSLDGIALAAQDVSPFPPGSYTGSIPAAWLKATAQYVLIGHRERRRYFHETVQDAANKVQEAISAGLSPILCVDRDIVGRQLAALDSPDMDALVVAYTPDDAVALEKERNLDDVSETAAYLAELTGGCPVLYGGGIHAGNVAGYMALPGLSGVMTASGCLDPHAFIDLLGNAGKALTEGKV